MVSITVLEVSNDPEKHRLLLPVHSPSSEKAMSSTVPRNSGSPSPENGPYSTQMDSAVVWLIHGLLSEEGMVSTVPVPEDTPVSAETATNSTRHNHGLLSPEHSHSDNGSTSTESDAKSTIHVHGMQSPSTSRSSEEGVSATAPRDRPNGSPETCSNSSLTGPDSRSSVHNSRSDEDMPFDIDTAMQVDSPAPQLNRTPTEPSLTLPSQDEAVAAAHLHSEAALLFEENLSCKTADVPQELWSSKSHPIAQKRVTFEDNPVSEERLFSEANPVVQDAPSCKAGTKSPESSCASPQKATGPSDSVAVPTEEGIYSAEAWLICQDALASRSTAHGLPADFLAQYPSLAIETLGGLSELAPHPSNDLAMGQIFIDSKTATTTLFVHDVDASWDFYHQVFPQAWFEYDTAGSFSMLFTTDKEARARKRSALEFAKVSIEPALDPNQARFRKVRPEGAPLDMAVKLVSRDTVAFATLCPFLYSDPVFPEITRITNALLRCPEWRADPTMEMESRDVSWPGGRRLDFTDLDGYGWRLVEEKRNRDLW
ncbi:hypothetical protein CONLIGDRAFT_670988 [Coniochaeta ligniaria NRRL 30616]|uniref:Uncharacterized protein n=1 Tax=Coniochaeta ligniaria NRRL 30616 TaxID=1408157 RepID=A0A1J7IIF9_9PEZI|nr:hypothetical protein CONLIGDRAFT_670988 [Coniochaeta ligniaria NRRL 30616]